MIEFEREGWDRGGHYWKSISRNGELVWTEEGWNHTSWAISLVFKSDDDGELLGPCSAAKLTHRRTGVGFGRFCSPEAAAQAAEAIDDMLDWDTFTGEETPEWDAVGERIFGIWRAAGLVFAFCPILEDGVWGHHHSGEHHADLLQ